MKPEPYRSMPMLKLRPAFFALLLLWTALGAQMAQAQAVNTGWFSNVAIKGYDPVAYFTESRAVKGNKAHSVNWRGARWLFSSADNKQSFAANPEQYAPQYGGFCAWAVARGDRAGIDPQQFTVHEGRLYLNYNADIQQQWTADKAALIKAADQQWPQMQ